MISAQHEVRIRRPRDEVFDFLADGTNNRRWQPMVRHTAQVEPTMGAGTSFRQSIRHPLGFTVSADYRIAEYQRPDTLALVVTSGGPIRPLLRYTLTPDGDGTVVHVSLEHPARGAGWLAAPLLWLFHPLWAWETRWVDRAGALLESGDSRSPQDPA